MKEVIPPCSQPAFPHWHLWELLLMEARAVPCGRKFPLQHMHLKKNFISNCFSRFHHWGPQPKPSNSSFGELWDSGGILASGIQYSKLYRAAVEDCSLHPSTNTMALSFFKAVPSTTLMFYRAGESCKMALLPGHFQPLKSKILGFTFLKYLFEMLIPQC